MSQLLQEATFEARRGILHHLPRCGETVAQPRGSNLSVTDGVYGILSQKDVSERIHGLGKINSSQESDDALDLGAQMARLEQMMLLALERSF